jgi:hypothetical protein
MRRLGITLVSAFVVFALAAADEPNKDTKLRGKLVGTWTLVSAKYGGQDFKFPEGMTHIKHVTPSQFMWATYDKDGVVSRAAGGSYTLKDEMYEETPEYGLGGDFDTIKGKAQKFRCKIDGDTWHHDGELSNGLTIEEVWERKPAK